MLNYIYQFIKNRKAKQLLARIAQIEPEWVASSTDGSENKILDYIMHGLGVYAQQKAAYEQHSPPVEGKLTVEAPVFSPILSACLDWWADDSPTVYARLWLLKEIELVQLRQKVTVIETWVNGHQAMADDYRHQYETLIQLSQEAQRIVQVATTINESIQPEKRLN